MKRVLPLVLLGSLIVLGLFVWISYEFFKQRTVQLPANTVFRYEPENDYKGRITVSFNGREYQGMISKDGMENVKNTGILTYRESCGTDGIAVLEILGWILGIIIICIHEIFKYIHLADSWDYDGFDIETGYPFVFGETRSYIYQYIYEYNLNPLKKKWRTFWGH